MTGSTGADGMVFGVFSIDDGDLTFDQTIKASVGDSRPGRTMRPNARPPPAC